MKYKSKEEAIKDHVENYRSDGVKKKKGFPNSHDYLRFQFIKSHIENDSLVLDVGCNSGILGLHLANKYCYVRGIDVVEELVEKAKKNGTHAQVGEAESLPYRDDFFDYVVCSEVLEHLYNPEEAIKEAYRVLNDGGMYIVTVPHPEATGNKLGDYHHQNFSYNIIDEIFSKYFKTNYEYSGIPYSQEYCIQVSATKKEADILLKKPQWLGIIAIKGEKNDG